MNKNSIVRENFIRCHLNHPHQLSLSMKKRERPLLLKSFFYLFRFLPNLHDIEFDKRFVREENFLIISLSMMSKSHKNPEKILRSLCDWLNPRANLHNFLSILRIEKKCYKEIHKRPTRENISNQILFICLFEIPPRRFLSSSSLFFYGVSKSHFCSEWGRKIRPRKLNIFSSNKNKAFESLGIIPPANFNRIFLWTLFD